MPLGRQQLSLHEDSKPQRVPLPGLPTKIQLEPRGHSRYYQGDDLDVTIRTPLGDVDVTWGFVSPKEARSRIDDLIAALKKAKRLI